MRNDAHYLPDSQMFAAGDVRANESVELMSLHTLFVREHNRIANALLANNPSFTDEELY
jgi:peroxidase